MGYINWIRERVGHEKIFLNFSGVCITDDKGNILLQRRGDKNKWGFPGGALELGESAEECAIREAKEETGLDIKIDYLIGVYTKYFDDYPNGDQAQPITFLFKGIVTGGSLKTDQKETLELKYFNPNQFPSLVNKQHEDFLNDVIGDKRGVYR
ncbi:ADP-ribose pyrophosphatase YjhB, NUDIX family [Evansella caseinilytica]|uniref:ADP-ribose pyrophosphatase YjhB, NUDIX family n=1 Tax=Evansella caseinilytica TaxID=1503961 RepID=A0A1H3RU08_9BACI|nr:ADP-ribose pyrophosphatase YjhB, NUDIX family [Evansella caseinilytica]